MCCLLEPERRSGKLKNRNVDRRRFIIKEFFVPSLGNLDTPIDVIKRTISGRLREVRSSSKIFSHRQSRDKDWELSRSREDVTQRQLTSTGLNRLHAITRAITMLWKVVGLGCLIASYVVVSWMLVRAAMGNHVQILSFNDMGELWFELGLWLVGFPQVVWWLSRYRYNERTQER